MEIPRSVLKKVFIRIKKIINPILILFIVFLLSCKYKTKELSDEEIWQQANKICQNNIIIDSHIDWPEWILSNPEDISEKLQNGDFDLVRANKGGLNAALSVIYINSDFNVEDGRLMVDSMLNIIKLYPKQYPEKFAMARNPGEIKKNFRKKLFSLPLCLENGSPIGNDIEFLKHLKDLGIVYITLCHNKTNQISDSNFDTLNKKWNGLSPFGIQVVNEMNHLGMIVDISHSTDSTVFQALRYSKAPIIASHSSCRYFVPGFERNLSDTLIKAIANKNGVVMINFCSMFLDSICKKNSDAVKWLTTNKVSMHSKEGGEFLREYIKTHKVCSDSKRIADHIDHIVKIAGIDYVGLGSDFDGIGPTQPIDVQDVSGYQVVVCELIKRGYSEKNIRKILSGNFFRVWNEVINVANS